MVGMNGLLNDLEGFKCSNVRNFIRRGVWSWELAQSGWRGGGSEVE